MKHVGRALLTFSIVAATAVGWGGPAQAHGHREVGEVAFTVGWAEEPAFVGFKNGVQLFLAPRDSEEPIEGAEETVKVEVGIGEEKTELMSLRTVFESPGEYRADLIPTVPGGYTFRFVGEVDGAKIDESFTSPEDGFDVVEGTADLAFPKAAPSTSELAERLDVVDQTAQKARDDLSLPRILSVVGIVIGLAALVMAARPRGVKV